jgi:hypothetical protein
MTASWLSSDCTARPEVAPLARLVHQLLERLRSGLLDALVQELQTLLHQCAGVAAAFLLQAREQVLHGQAQALELPSQLHLLFRDSREARVGLLRCSVRLGDSAPASASSDKRSRAEVCMVRCGR